MSYYVQLLLGEGMPLPEELCEYILEFSNIVVPVVSSKENTPVGWLYYCIGFKRLEDVRYESELDICRQCGDWRANCKCSSLRRIL